MKDLKEKVKALHGCDATHIAADHVLETFRGQTVWEGDVEVYELHGHPKAKRAYAWEYDEGNGSKRVVSVLELPPVNSALTAVRVAIASGQIK